MYPGYIEPSYKKNAYQSYVFNQGMNVWYLGRYNLVLQDTPVFCLYPNYQILHIWI